MNRYARRTPEQKQHIVNQRRERRAARRLLNPDAIASESRRQRETWDDEKRVKERAKARERYHRLRKERPETDEYYRQRSIRNRSALSFQAKMFMSAKNRATRRGIAFEIEMTDIVVPEFCPILGIPLDLEARGRPSQGSPSLDRVDNSKGYLKGNIEVISYRANALKRDSTPDEIRRLHEFYKRRLPSI